MNGMFHGFTACFETTFGNQSINSIPCALVDEHRRLVESLGLLP